MRYLLPNMSFPIPHPPQMSNKGNFIVSLSQVTAWLAEQAEALGVEIYPGFAGARLLFDDNGAVKGVGTNDVGLDKDGRMKDSYEPGMDFLAKVTLLSEGAHGSLSKQAMAKYDLRKDCDPQCYGLGLKEVWKVREDAYVAGKVGHTVGWPMDNKTYGGGWEYHMEGGLVSIGLVVGLDYQNPYLSPYKEFQVRFGFLSHVLARALGFGMRLLTFSTPPFPKPQRMKHHPYYKKLLEGGECLAYGGESESHDRAGLRRLD